MKYQSIVATALLALSANAIADSYVWIDSNDNVFITSSAPTQKDATMIALIPEETAHDNLVTARVEKPSHKTTNYKVSSLPHSPLEVVNQSPNVASSTTQPTTTKTTTNVAKATTKQFAVQVASYKNATQAESFAQQLKNSGFESVFLKVSGTQSTPITAVYIGPTPYSNAKQTISQIKNDLQLDGLIVNYKKRS